jgi:hypothetical protein
MSPDAGMSASGRAEERPSHLLEEVRALRGLIERNAVENEHASELGAELRQAIEEANLLRLMAPREVGGLEADPQLLIDVLRELSYYDGSTGWYCGAVMTAAAVAGAFLGDRAGRHHRPAVPAGRAVAVGQLPQHVDQQLRIGLQPADLPRRHQPQQVRLLERLAQLRAEFAGVFVLRGAALDQAAQGADLLQQAGGPLAGQDLGLHGPLLSAIFGPQPKPSRKAEVLDRPVN